METYKSASGRNYIILALAASLSIPIMGGPRGVHRNVACETCGKVVRSDNMKRHVRVHEPTVTKERKAITPETRTGTIAKQQQLFDKLLKSRDVAVVNGKYVGTDPSKTFVQYFGDFPYVVGNMTHKNNLNKIIRCHYNYINESWGKGHDGIEASDKDWRNVFIDNVDIFNVPKETWFHVICEDLHLYGRLREIDFNGNFETIEGATECCCSEIQKEPLTREDVDILVSTHQTHMHFLIKSDKMCWSEIYDSIKVLSNDRIAVSNRGGGSGPLDKARMLHYVCRRESSVGLCCHVFMKKNCLNRFFVYQQTWESIESQIVKIKLDKQMIMLNCKQCRKRRKNNMPCCKHMYLNNVQK